MPTLQLCYHLQDGSSTISREEFMDFGNVLLLEFTKASDYATFVETRFPKLFATRAYQRFCSIVQSAWFESSIDFILLLNAIVIGIQSYPELSGSQVTLDESYWDGSIDTIWELVETLFTVIYTLEVIAKTNVYGWKRYTESPKNVFDFTITVLAVISSIIVYYPNQFSDSRIIRMIVMGRVLRLLRLLTSVRRFQLIVTICSEILPAASSVLLILFLLLYFFSILGVHLYGGLITRDPANPLSYLVLNTDFANNDYWANNFNDPISGMNVLFNLLVVNNWTECESGYEATTQAKWVRWFFFFFHIFGVVVMMNLVTGVIINEFLTQLAVFKERTEEEVVGDGEAVLYHRRAVFDAAVITGTRTTLRGDYIARFREDAENIVRERLRQLFTQTNQTDANK
jgi:two pore calcium channel protein, plant